MTSFLPFAFEWIATNPFLKYLHWPTTHAEKKMLTLLPQKFEIMFDSSTQASIYYKSITAPFPTNDACGYQFACLSSSPLQN